MWGRSKRGHRLDCFGQGKGDERLFREKENADLFYCGIRKEGKAPGLLRERNGIRRSRLRTPHSMREPMRDG